MCADDVVKVTSQNNNFQMFSESAYQPKMPLPKIPRLEKFCFCMDVHTGVKSFSLGLIILWVIYAIGALFGSNSTVGKILDF